MDTTVTFSCVLLHFRLLDPKNVLLPNVVVFLQHQIPCTKKKERNVFHGTTDSPALVNLQKNYSHGSFNSLHPFFRILFFSLPSETLPYNFRCCIRSFTSIPVTKILTFSCVRYQFSQTQTTENGYIHINSLACVKS